MLGGALCCFHYPYAGATTACTPTLLPLWLTEAQLLVGGATQGRGTGLCGAGTGHEAWALGHRP